MNYYEELGVGREAGEAEIRRAYRRVVRLFHPDQYPDPEIKAIAGRQMIRLNDIVQTLTNPERRYRYDMFLLSGFRSAPIPLRGPMGQRFRGRLRMSSAKVQASLRSLGNELSGARRPFFAAVFFACVIVFVAGFIHVDGIRHAPALGPAKPRFRFANAGASENPGSRASSVPTKPAAARRKRLESGAPRVVATGSGAVEVSGS